MQHADRQAETIHCLRLIESRNIPSPGLGDIDRSTGGHSLLQLAKCYPDVKARALNERNHRIRPCAEQANDKVSFPAKAVLTLQRKLRMPNLLIRQTLTGSSQQNGC